MEFAVSLQPVLSLSRDGSTVDLKNRKAQAMLAYFVLTGRAHDREHLATLFWGDRFDTQARASLRQALFALRRALGNDALEGEDPIGLAQGVLDVEEPDPGQPILSGFTSGSDDFDAWLQAERERRARDAAQAVVAEAEAAPTPEAAAPLWQRALDLDPGNEAVLRSLMSALAALERRSEALTAYAGFAEMLQRDLGATPSADTVALADAIRTGNKASPVIAHFTGDRASDEAHIHALFTPFEDLGGGDLAGFFAHELPAEIAMRARAFNLESAFADPESPTDRILAEARERGAECVITGSARQIGDRIRVSAKIAAAKDNAIRWSGQTVLHESEAFDALTRFANEAVSELARHVAEFATAEEYKQKLEAQIDTPEAFHTTLGNFISYAFFAEHGRAQLGNLTRIIDQAAERFPTSVNVLVWQAYFRFHAAHLGAGVDRVASYHEARRINDRALALDSANQQGLAARIIFATWTGDFAEADATYQAMLDMDTSFHAHDGLYAVSLIFRGDLDRADALLRASIERERATPLLFYRYAYLGLIAFLNGEDEAALNWAHRSLDVGREFFLSHLVMIAALARLGREEEASHQIERSLADFGPLCVSEFDFLPFTDPARKDELLDALRAAGLPE